jgi:hypothetical protein
MVVMTIGIVCVAFLASRITKESKVVNFCGLLRVC